MGHCLLATTPASLFEHPPLPENASGSVITVDVGLDNRSELLHDLALSKLAATSAAPIVLWAYLAWGESCVDRLLGDCAFTIWDPRPGTLFCAHDDFGIKRKKPHPFLRASLRLRI